MEAVLGALFLKNVKIVSAMQKSKAIHVSLEKISPMKWDIRVCSDPN